MCVCVCEQVVCIGGGYIGMETAAGVASQGVDTSVIMPEDRLLARLLTPKVSDMCVCVCDANIHTHTHTQ